MTEAFTLVGLGVVSVLEYVFRLLYNWPILVVLLVAAFFYHRRSAWYRIRRTVSRTVFLNPKPQMASSGPGFGAQQQQQQPYLAAHKAGHRRIKSLGMGTSINTSLPPPPIFTPVVPAALSRSNSVSKLA